jgi:protein involved in polysaccharide export with SLBB domain
VAGLLLVWLVSGCAALTNPLANGLPVDSVAPEILGQSRQEEQPIPFTLLRQPPPPAYLLAPGDILAVYVEGVLGERNVPPPAQTTTRPELPPAVGYPITVDLDGTITLPLIGPLRVEGKTIPEARELIREAYISKEILKRGAERILVSMQKPRSHQVLVVREDSGGTVPTSEISGPGIQIGGTSAAIVGNLKRGTGATLFLPAYENDVLNALTRTGGLPGLEAKNEVIIYRGDPRGRQGWPTVMPGQLIKEAAGYARPVGPEVGPDGGQIVRIPLRLRPGEPIPFRPEDVILQSGDIVYIPARDAELYYTGGLIPPGEFVLPRDHDLDVVEAVSRTRGPLFNGGVNQSNISGQIFSPGIGFPSPSLLSVIRSVPGKGKVVLRVDLNRAVWDSSQRILVQPGDMLILQETVGEAVTRYFTQQFRLNFLGRIINERDLQGTATLTVP